ncbi:MAG TPA: LysR family transcriptional regulator [Clostridiaceae bacterium]|nr:LysR family transcriptional regulator [Clostridiaceae bacterium]
MNMLYFKYAIEVERTGSITQAADNLFMGQPSLSKAIKELEDAFGITIFKRTSKGVVVTPKGKEFLKYAKKVIAQIDEMKAICSDDNFNKQILNISVPRSSYIAKAVTNFISSLDIEKGIEINIKETNSMEAIHSIIESQFNLGIIRYETVYENYFIDFLNNKDIMHDVIWEFDSLVTMSKENPLAASEKISEDDLEKYIEIKFGDISIPYISKEGESYVDKNKERKRVIYVYERSSQIDLLSNIPITYMWESPIPNEYLERYNLVQKTCKTKKGNRCKDVLIYPKNYSFNELEKRFLDKLHELKNSMVHIR